MFFTTPTLPPSGVSAGHKNPHVVLCSLRGGMSLPLLSMGVLMRRKWLKLEMYVNRFNTCATPTFVELTFFMPKSPVDSAFLMPFSMVEDLMILYTLVRLMMLKKSSVDRHYPVLISRITCFVMSFTSLLK